MTPPPPHAPPQERGPAARAPPAPRRALPRSLSRHRCCWSCPRHCRRCRRAEPARAEVPHLCRPTPARASSRRPCRTARAGARVEAQRCDACTSGYVPRTLHHGDRLESHFSALTAGATPAARGGGGSSVSAGGAPRWRGAARFACGLHAPRQSFPLPCSRAGAAPARRAAPGTCAARPTTAPAAAAVGSPCPACATPAQRVELAAHHEPRKRLKGVALLAEPRQVSTDVNLGRGARAVASSASQLRLVGRNRTPRERAGSSCTRGCAS